MSYARFGLDGSDVYVIATGEGWRCIECRLPHANGDHVCTTRSGMMGHLGSHRVAGHKVPQAAFDRLEREREGPPGLSVVKSDEESDVYICANPDGDPADVLRVEITDSGPIVTGRMGDDPPWSVVRRAIRAAVRAGAKL